MRLILFFSLIFSAQVSANELGCQDPSGDYYSIEGATLKISPGLKIQVLSQDKEKLFLGEILNFEKFKVSEYNNFANSPEVKSTDLSLAKWAILHIGENCHGIKMVWFLGSEFKKRKLVGKYYFEKNT